MLRAMLLKTTVKQTVQVIEEDRKSCFIASLILSGLLGAKTIALLGYVYVLCTLP